MRASKFGQMNNVPISTIFIVVLLATFLFGCSSALANSQDNVVPVGGPSSLSTPRSLQTVIQNIFNLALLVSGILAFGAVIYGAFMYTFSAGNPGMQSDARDQILQAFLGLALLLGGYLILNTINPNLTNMTLSPIPAITPPESQVPKLGTGTGCAGGGQCASLSNCQQTSRTSGIGATNCGAAPVMATLISCVAQTYPGFKVTEGYPPAVPHSDSRHNNGCAVDIKVTGGSNVCASVTQLMNAVSVCGGASFNEYYDAGCSGASNPSTRTGDHLHVSVSGGGC